MIKQATVAVSLFAAAFAAMAFEASQWTPATGQATRAEVKAEVARALSNGEIARGEGYGAIDYTRASASTLTRADVKSELARAREAGELDGRDETYGGMSVQHPHANTRFFGLRSTGRMSGE